MQRDSEVRVLNNKISYCTKRGCKTCFPHKSSPSICPETLGQETEVESLLKSLQTLRFCETDELLLIQEIKYLLQRNIIIIVIAHHKFY